MAEQTKEARIKSEIARLDKIFSNIEENKKKLIKKLIDNAAFMTITLEELQKSINEDGPVITSINGNGFETINEHPAQKSYNQMIAKYTSTIKQLTDLLPDSKEDSVSKAGESLAKFVAQGKPKGRLSN